MTKLVYFNDLYKKYIERDNIINNLEVKYLQELINSCSSTDLFINSIWGEVDDTLIELVKQKPSRAIIYSGMDWENTSDLCRKNFNDYIKKNIKNIIHIGNSDGEGYFSFWLFFTEKYFASYPINKVEFNNPKNVYMCLNRKRHKHRVKLVDRFKEEGLLEYGLVSLGGDSENNIPQLNLNVDVDEVDGNKATNYQTDNIPNDISSIGDLTNWNSTLINVVTETTTHTHTFISEKTWKPIVGLRPFMIVGDYKIYSYLKEYGIDTFDDIFGTGYEHPWVHKRIEWVISNLKKYSNTNLLDMYKDLYPRLVKNKLQLKKIFEINSSRYQKAINLLKNNN